MNDKPNWRVAHIDDIERVGKDIPGREHLGIRAFGIGAYTPGEDATLLGEHDHCEGHCVLQEVWVGVSEETRAVLEGHTLAELVARTRIGHPLTVPADARS